MFKQFKFDLHREFAGYNGKKLSQDVMAGLTVAAVALPLALAFGVSSGADAAAGLVTAIIAGLVIGVFSGASYQISGPTGAMAGVLIVLSSKYGISGVLTAGFLSGIIMIIAAKLKAGSLVSYIPQPVIAGFTSGIAVIIAIGQLDNFFGTTSAGDGVIAKLLSYSEFGFSPNMMTAVYGIIVVLIMVFYPKKLNAIVPSSLVSIITVLIINIFMFPDGTAGSVAEVGTIPKSLMTKDSLLTNGFMLHKISELIMPAVSIAALGMIESLLCGASAGKAKGERLDAERELVAQGIGNIVIPLFGGVPATAAIARTLVAIKSGGQTRLVSVFHSIALVLSMFLLGDAMSRIPLSALAGVLMVTAWRMNEWHAIKCMFNNKMKSAITKFAVTMTATIVFDLTTAICAGIAVSMLLFVVKSSKLSIVVSDIDAGKLGKDGLGKKCAETKIVYITGNLFFGTQEQLTTAINNLSDYTNIIFSMRGVPSIDSSAITELCEIIAGLWEKGVTVYFCGVQPNVKRMLERAWVVSEVGEEKFFWDAVEAIGAIEYSRTPNLCKSKEKISTAAN